MKQPSSMVQMYANLHKNSNLALKPIKEEYSEPTVFEKLYKVINKKKGLVKSYQNKIRRILSGPFRGIDGIDCCSMKSYKTHSSYSFRSVRSCSSRASSVDSFRSYQGSLVSSLKSRASSRRSSKSSRRSKSTKVVIPKENPLNGENMIEKFMFLLAAIVSRDFVTINEQIKILNVVKSKRFISLLLFVFIAYFCQNKTIEIKTKPSSNSFTLEVQPTDSEMTEIKKLVFNSGVAFNLPQETMSKIHQNIKTPYLKTPKSIDSTFSVSSPKFDVYIPKEVSPQREVNIVDSVSEISQIISDNVHFHDMVTDILQNSLE